MIIRILLMCCCLNVIISQASTRMAQEEKCLTGYMTERQSWVNGSGVLTVRQGERNAIDLSYTRNPFTILRQKVIELWSGGEKFQIKYLSLAKCGLTRVPLIYQIIVADGHTLSETLEFMTFYGNDFASVHYLARDYDELFNATDSRVMALDATVDPEAANMWSSSLQQFEFPLLKELDLRACSIQVLSANIFRGMKALQALYLGENEILHIHSAAFAGLQNLLHLDFSRNNPIDQDGQPQNIVTESFLVFEDLINLESLDLSFTRLAPRNRGMVMGSKKKLKSLSICSTGLSTLNPRAFSQMSLEILDVSNNNEILDAPEVLRGVEKTLRILYASAIRLKSLDIFKDFKKLEILQLSDNEIGHIQSSVASSLKNLQVLDLEQNRLTNWMNSTFSLMPKLRLLILRSNNINMISYIMNKDIRDIDYVAMSENFIVCSCEAKDFYEMAANNENKFNDTRIVEISPRDSLHHIGYEFYNKMISSRKPIVYKGKLDVEDSGRFRLLDYDKGLFTCFKVPDGVTVSFIDVSSCYRSKSDKKDITNDLKTGKNLLLILIVIPCVLLPMLLFYIFRRKLKYFVISVRNSAVMGLISKNSDEDDGTIYNYDVFVSYCNEDRSWVLNHLLPHMEAECNISVCLHERDFQVGLSILENIVLCMDRSRFIMLVLSQRFLISRWCQFEMHLAQHRLLETRREDLILVLLEDIPRRIRPNTLHYLMLTKTYIVWPTENSERQLFWKRLKKSLLSQKTRAIQNVSLA